MPLLHDIGADCLHRLQAVVQLIEKLFMQDRLVEEIIADFPSMEEALARHVETGSQGSILRSF